MELWVSMFNLKLHFNAYKSNVSNNNVENNFTRTQSQKTGCCSVKASFANDKQINHNKSKYIFKKISLSSANTSQQNTNGRNSTSNYTEEGRGSVSD